MAVPATLTLADCPSARFTTPTPLTRIGLLPKYTTAPVFVVDDRNIEDTLVLPGRWKLAVEFFRRVIVVLDETVGMPWTIYSAIETIITIAAAIAIRLTRLLCL